MDYLYNSQTKGTTKEYWVRKYFSDRNITKLISKKYTLEDVIQAILTDTPGRLHTKLGLSAAGAGKLVKKLFPDKGSNTSWFTTYILSVYNQKYCASCDNVFDNENFNKSSSNPTGLQSQCKYCQAVYVNEHTYIWSNINSKKRQKFNSPLSLMHKEEIQEIYKNCPYGYQVDHIIPVNGTNVSGLHVPWNLQYLTIKDNLIKSNKHVP